MTIDHSLTYKRFKMRNIPHFMRLRKLRQLVKSECVGGVSNYGDFGCSNGYLTNIFEKLITPNYTCGFDQSENIKKAELTYPELEFECVNLNHEISFSRRFDCVTCFETLEHVGDISMALKNLKRAASHEGKIIISVPIEIGVIGILKYILKRFFYGYHLTLECGDFRYFQALLLGKDISQFRSRAEGYSSHFGFDYRALDKSIMEVFSSYEKKLWNSGTTRFYVIKKLNN